MHAVRLLATHLRNPAMHEDPVVRGELMLAAVLCGQGTDFTGAGIATVLGHAIGARHATDNGVVKAIVLPYVLRFNTNAASAGLKKLAASLGLSATREESRSAVVDAITAVFSTLGVPRRLRDVGIPREALHEVATHAMRDWFLRGNPRPVRDVSELMQILDEAW
jgi:alcohol dehydrogenase class IV